MLRTVLLVLLVAAVIAGGSYYAYYHQATPKVEIVAKQIRVAEDPRLVFPTPYLNVRPEVKYVGDAACSQCHEREASSYHHHPMGISSAFVSDALPVEKYDAKAHNPFEKFGFQFSVEREGGKLYHTVTKRDAQKKELFKVKHEVLLAVGSGTRGRAYLNGEGNYVFQTPINWFTQGDRFDIAPNVGTPKSHNYFYPVNPLCVYCHTNQSEPDVHTLNRYKAPLAGPASIGCERCHGPGDLHVKRREKGEVIEGLDNTIVNPRRLEPGLREGVCMQCHLQGEARVARRGRENFEFRPGLPFEAYWSVFAKPPEETNGHQAVSHFEQMYVSKCFVKSAGKMGCISCHDPHVRPTAADRVGYFRKSCLACHEDKTPCTAPRKERQAKEGDSCIACHMQRVSSKDVAHTALTDHRVLRTLNQKFELLTARKSPVFPRGASWIYFHEDGKHAIDKDVLRDAALAAMDRAELLPQDVTKLRMVSRALPLLEASLADAPDDVPALEAKGYALWVLEKKQEAFDTLKTVLEKVPERELTLLYIADLAANLNKPELAEEYWKRLIAINPHSPQYRLLIGKYYARFGRMDKAIEQARESLKINPANFEVRMFLIQCLVTDEQKDVARKEMEFLISLDPPEKEMLKQKLEGIPR